MKKLFFAVLFAPLAVFASGDELQLDRADIDLRDAISIQRGARVFVNYCLNCHSASLMRYNRLTDLGLTEQQIKENLLFTADKVGNVNLPGVRDIITRLRNEGPTLSPEFRRSKLRKQARALVFPLV